MTAKTSQVITVTSSTNAAPVSRPGGPYTGTAAVAVSLSGATSTDSDGTIASYAWNFGDSTTGTGVSPTHVYASAGTYTVTLTVTDNLGATGTATTTATISQAANVLPVARAGGPYTGTAGQAVSLSGATSTDSDGTIASYAWNFGDSTTGTGATTTHAYAAAGTYTVSLTVTDNRGGTNTATTTATIAQAANVLPVARAGGPYTGTAGQAVSLSGATSTDSDGTIASYAWNFGDSTTGTGATTTHSYAAAGTYTVSLTVTDNRGGTNTATTTATIAQAANVLPVARAGGPYTGTAGQAVSLSGATSTDSDGTIASYAWNFGDSTTGTGATTTHSYAAAGTYTVSLTVTDNRGGTNTATTTATIAQAANVLPVARPGGPYTGTSGQAVSLSGATSTDSDGTIASYAWNFGDSTTGTGATTTHSYAAAGTYTVSLTVTDNRGGTNTAATTASISVPVVALKSGTAIGKISGSAGSIKIYRITVPSGQTLLEISTTGGAGDCDMNVTDPLGITVKRIMNTTSYEYAQISNPAGGDWFIHLNGQTAYANITLLAKYSKATAVAAAPAGLFATDGTFADRIVVTWKPSAGATSYEVYRNSSNALLGADFTMLGETSSTIFEDSTAESNKVYYYFVTTKNAIGTSKFSTGNSGYVSKTPSIPGAVTSSDGTYFDRIRVAWAKTTGATSYMIFRTESAATIPDPAISTPIGEVNTLFLDDFGDDILPQVGGIVKKYFYWIAAKNQNGVTAISKTNNGYLSKKGPAALTASNGTYSNRITVTWSAVPGATAYDVYRCTDRLKKLDELKIGDAVGATAYDDISAVKDTVYYYRIKAKYGNRYDSDFSLLSAIGKAAGSFNPPPTAVLANSVPSDMVGAMVKGSSVYFSADVPVGTTRLVATLDGTPPPAGTMNDCDLLAKFANYPTVKSYGAKGVENKVSEILTVSNPAAGTWYFLLHGATAYSNVTLTLNCYSVADIVLTQVPTNDLAVPSTAAFKGKVVDEAGAGIPNIVVLARNPVTGLTSALTKTDAKGVFAYSALINSEGEHTFDFLFNSMPDIAKGTASHTVATKKGCLEANSYFDISSYLPAKPVPVTAQADIVGLQNFLDTRNGWDEDAINTTYETMWVENTIINTGNDTQLNGKLDEGLYMFFYGVEGAGAGNDTTSMSAFSAVPFAVHVESSMMAGVLANLKLLGLVDVTQETAIMTGGIGVVALASIGEPDEGATPSNISLLASEQLELLAKIAGNSGTSGTIDAIYSGVTVKQITVTFADGRKLDVVGSAYLK
ncbi:MAG: hypothetical protein A2X45_21005 [Lentisphaerae bacterium GWF2_50_93]|nr:MAG: hypothetical protein A2X45_21005 [Lentisphaerae bacterium GWF2_50_93]